MPSVGRVEGCPSECNETVSLFQVALTLCQCFILGLPSLGRRLQNQEGFILDSWEDLRACWQLIGININCWCLALTARPEGRIKTIFTQLGFATVLFHYHSLSQVWRTQK